MRWSTPVMTSKCSIGGRLRFVVTPMAIIDLLAILPFYLYFLPVDLRFVRAFRLVRVVRIAKVARYIAALTLFSKVLRNKREELILTSVAALVVIVVASCLMHFAESEIQPQAFPDIPRTMWWAVATLTTVGYGDVYPVTDLGKVLAAVVALAGIGLVALPTGILGSGFVEEIEKRRGSARCPHCGGELGGT